MRLNHRRHHKSIVKMATENVTSEVTTYTITMYDLHEILFIVFCLVGITLDVLVIYTIARFNKLRTANTVYIANWALIDIFSLITTPSTYAIIYGLEHLSEDVVFMSGYIKLGVLLHVAVMLAMLVITFDWNLAAYFPNASKLFRRQTTIVLALFWIVTGVCGIISLAVCRTFTLCVVDDVALLIFFAGLGLYVIILNIIRIVQKYRTNPLQHPALSLNISTLFVVTWAFGFFNIGQIKWIIRHPLLSLVMDCATFSSPIVNFLMLYYYDTDFKECVRQVLRRPVKSEDQHYQFKNPIVINKCAIDIPIDQPVSC